MFFSFFTNPTEKEVFHCTAFASRTACSRCTVAAVVCDSDPPALATLPTISTIASTCTIMWQLAEGDRGDITACVSLADTIRRYSDSNSDRNEERKERKFERFQKIVVRHTPGVQRCECYSYALLRWLRFLGGSTKKPCQGLVQVQRLLSSSSTPPTAQHAKQWCACACLSPLQPSHPLCEPVPATALWCSSKPASEAT